MNFVIRREILKNDGTPSGRVQYMTKKDGLIQFESPGNTRTGVGVANLYQCKTRQGIDRFMTEYKSYFEHANKVGPISVVESN